MMYDPPDFPYKDLHETMKEHYGSEDVLFNPSPTTEYVTERNCLDGEANLLRLSSNEAGREFSGELLSSNILNHGNSQLNPELYIVQSENLFNYEPVLLDDNTVNQFLLPLEVPAHETNKDSSIGPDLLALHSCSICHEIFISENDLLEHSTSVHAIQNTVNSDIGENILFKNIDYSPNDGGKQLQPDTEWLVCSICERVLSTALEIDPLEQSCCKNGNGKSSLSTRTLLTMYVCEFCSSLFADGDALDRHRNTCIKMNHDKENIIMDQNVTNVEIENAKSVSLFLSCDMCGVQIESLEELQAHTSECQPVKERRHRANGATTKMWNCGSCNQLFATARDLYRHKRGEDRPEGTPLTAFVCEECDKVLGSMCALHTHKKMHKVSKPGYPCRICGRRFNQSGHLAIHMRMHTGERPYPCDLCPKAFKVKVERDDHRRTHTGERPFACTACPKTFTAAARLREHARIHTDQRPYRCDICGAAFRRPYARTVHTLIHTGAKPHECDVCGTAFRRSGDMWKHKRTLHGSSSAGMD